MSGREEFEDALREDARIEDLLDRDYDFFCDYYKDDIAIFKDAYVNLKKLHELNAWEFDIEGILG